MAGNITGIDELEARLMSNIISVLDGRNRGVGQIPQIMMGIESGNMPWRELTKLILNPAGDTLELLVIIIHRGNDIGHHLNMHTPLIFGPLGDIKCTSPVRHLGQITVKDVREALDINTPGIKVRPV